MEKTHTVLFVSRNKDNKGIEGFKRRKRTFLADLSDHVSIDKLLEKFHRFVNEGVSNEKSRFYVSVNARDKVKTRKALLHYFVDAEDLPLSKYESSVVSIASRAENRLENKWLFDYDSEDGNGVDIKDILEFLNDLKLYVGGDVGHLLQRTKTGYAVVVDKGFDTRELLEKWKNVSLHRDGMLYISLETNNKSEQAKSNSFAKVISVINNFD